MKSRTRDILLGLVLVTCSSVVSASPAARFPDFKTRAAALKRVVVLVEVSQIVDVRSGPDQFDLRASRKIARNAAEVLPRALIGRGLPVQRSSVASVGGAAAELPVVWMHADADAQVDSAGRAVLPTDVDSTLTGVGLEAWLALVDRIWAERWNPVRESHLLEQAVEVGRRYECDAVAVLLLAGARMSVARKLIRSPLDFGMAANAPLITLRIVDTRDGSLLWADDEIMIGRLDNKMHLGEILKQMADRLPRLR